MIDFRLPNLNGKTDAEKIDNIARYLYQLTEDLNYSFESMSRSIQTLHQAIKDSKTENIGAWMIFPDFLISAHGVFGEYRFTISGAVAQSKGYLFTLIVPQSGIKYRLYDRDDPKNGGWFAEFDTYTVVDPTPDPPITA